METTSWLTMQHERDEARRYGEDMHARCVAAQNERDELGHQLARAREEQERRGYAIDRLIRERDAMVHQRDMSRRRADALAQLVQIAVGLADGIAHFDGVLNLRDQPAHVREDWTELQELAQAFRDRQRTAPELAQRVKGEDGTKID
jgi:hypothetical protein